MSARMDEVAMTPDASRPMEALQGDGVALWRQIAGTLAREIAGGAPGPGLRLPTEAQLAQRFGVNRHTLRRAMEELARDGLIRIEHGRGAFVAEDVLDYTVGPRTRFSETVRRHNMEPSGRVLRLEERTLGRTPAERQVAGALGLRPGARVVELERIGLADERPVSLANHYFPASRLPGLAEALRAAPGITQALQRAGVADYLRQSTRVSARLPTAAEAALLRTARIPPTAGVREYQYRSRRPGDRVRHRPPPDAARADRVRTCRGPAMNQLTITGGDVLEETGLVRRELCLRDGRIADRGDTDGLQLDAAGLLVLPGIVDVHGDAFERQLQPRPGVDFPVDIALAETERQLLANGITTAFHGVTLSWEPGLRSLPAWSALLDALDAARPNSACDMRVHLRWEAFNLDALEVATADIAAGRVHMLGLNDHTPGIVRKLTDPVATGKVSGRGPLAPAEFAALAHRVAARAPEVPAARARIAAAARAAGLPIASHDDATVEERAAGRALGAAICEFPMAEAVGLAARDAGEFVVMGAPNVLRGGSHLGWASAARLAEAGICNVLASDYYYPALLQAAFVLAGRGVLTLAQSWALVAANPARAAGLADRGRIAAGLRADLALVAPGPLPRLVATIAGGRPVWLAPDAAARLERPRNGRKS